MKGTLGHALCVGAVAFILSGCGGTQSLSGAPGRPSQLASAVHADREQNWMLPEAKKLKQLLYVSVGTANDVYVYDYKTGEQVGLLTGFDQPQGQCVDAVGNVWITNFGDPSTSGYAVEYAHGGITVLSKLSVGGPSMGCSIDPTSGNLAVATAWGGNGAELVVFKNASGVPAVSTDPFCDSMNSPAYDDKGLLYVEGYGCTDGSGCGQHVCTLQNGLMTTDVNIHDGGGMMWDGKYMTLSDTVNKHHRGKIHQETVIYQMAEDSHGNLTRVGETVLSCHGRRIRQPSSPPLEQQPFIVGSTNTPITKRQGNVVVFANKLCPQNFNYWSYPSGGKALRSLHLPSTGESVSFAP